MASKELNAVVQTRRKQGVSEMVSKSPGQRPEGLEKTGVLGAWKVGVV